MSAGFNIEDVCNLLDIRILHRHGGNFGTVCPFCGDRRGKMNMCVTKNGQVKNTYHCFNAGCDAKGNMLTLYADIRGIYGEDRYKQAYREIREGLNLSTAKSKTEHVVKQSQGRYSESEHASEYVCDQTYRMLLSLLQLSDVHERKLMERGFTKEQIVEYGFKSTPVFGTTGICRKLLRSGCILEGVPGFYLNEKGDYDVRFSLKNAGFLIPVMSTEGLIEGFQIRLDRPYDGRKYIWLSTSGRNRGASSGSPVGFYGNPCDETICVTEGPLKGMLAHGFAGYSFACVPGVSQYKNLRRMLISCKENGCKHVVEMYDMDKYLNTMCDHQEGKHCTTCNGCIGECIHKREKRDGIRKGCKRLYEICAELNLSVSRKVWDMGEDVNWRGELKGIDDYLYAMVKKRKEEYEKIVKMERKGQ